MWWGPKQSCCRCMQSIATNKTVSEGLVAPPFICKIFGVICMMLWPLWHMHVPRLSNDSRLASDSEWNWRYNGELQLRPQDIMTCTTADLPPWQSSQNPHNLIPKAVGRHSTSPWGGRCSKPSWLSRQGPSKWLIQVTSAKYPQKKHRFWQSFISLSSNCLPLGFQNNMWNSEFPQLFVAVAFCKVRETGHLRWEQGLGVQIKSRDFSVSRGKRRLIQYFAVEIVTKYTANHNVAVFLADFWPQFWADLQDSLIWSEGHNNQSKFKPLTIIDDCEYKT